MDSSPMDTCSPVEAITSSSRALASGLISFASARSRFVSPAISEGTTTRRWPSFTKRWTRRATSRMRSGLPMEVPPYFWTIRDTGGNRQAKTAILACQFVYSEDDSLGAPTVKSQLRPHTLAVLALACGVAASALAWFAAGLQVEREGRAKFAAQSGLAVGLLERRIQRYLDLLYGVAGLAY